MDSSDLSHGLDPALHAGVWCPHLLVHALSREPLRPAFHFSDGRVFTVGDLRDCVSGFVQSLDALGVRPGTRVGVLSRNRPEVIFTQVALRLVGACWVSLSPMASLDDLDYIVADAELEVLIFDPDHFQPAVAELQARHARIAHLLAMGPTDVGIDIVARSAGFAPAPLQAPAVSGEHICRISYSGGTTGQPKGVMHSERSQLEMTRVILQEWEWPAEIRYLVCAPLSHAAAALLVPILLKGGSIVVQPGFDPEAVMEAVERFRITSTLLVPTMIYRLLDHPRLDEFDLSSLETVFYGAAAISPPRLQEALRRMGRVFFQFYGQTEAPMSITVLRRAEHDPDDLRRLASCGRPVPWIHAELLGPDDHPVADGEPGEICVRGPLVSCGYLHKPEQTAEAFAGGWLRTGDVAVRDPGGWWRIVDRKKDMIVSGGFNVYPREVEDVIAMHPAVAAVTVIGVPDPHWGEAVKAVVVCRAGMQVSGDALVSLVREKKGPVQAPKSVDFLDAIPLTPLGKPDKKALRQTYLDGAGLASSC